jgi:hypothetical protein
VRFLFEQRQSASVNRIALLWGSRAGLAKPENRVIGSQPLE